MATEVIDKDYVIIKVPKSIGISGIRRIRDYVKIVEANKNNPPIKLGKKKIAEIARKINKNAWENLKKKRGLDIT